VGIAHGGADVLVAEQLLDFAQILSHVVEQNCCRGVPEPMDGDLPTPSHPRDFGFVTMDNVSEGNAAIKGLDGTDRGGRKLKVNEARPMDDSGGSRSSTARRR
jgi:RNA recognition motif-containing protein